MTREEAREHIKGRMELYIHSTLDNFALHKALEALEQPEQKKGIWKKRVAVHKINGESRNAIVCSICGSGYFTYDTSENTESVMPNYCPHCGAKMGERNDEN